MTNPRAAEELLSEQPYCSFCDRPWDEAHRWDWRHPDGLETLRKRLQETEAELKLAQRFLALAIEAAGGEIVIPHKVLLRDYTDLTIFREDRPTDDGYRWFVRRLGEKETQRGN